MFDCFSTYLDVNTSLDDAGLGGGRSLQLLHFSLHDPPTTTAFPELLVELGEKGEGLVRSPCLLAAQDFGITRKSSGSPRSMERDVGLATGLYGLGHVFTFAPFLSKGEGGECIHRQKAKASNPAEPGWGHMSVHTRNFSMAIAIPRIALARQ